MTFLHAFLLGILQGLTEFIPVSSTAHLLIVQKLLGIPASDAMFSFLVLVQIGTILSLIVYFWKDLWEIAKAMFKNPFAKSPDALARLGWYLLIATIPALIAGVLLKDAVEALFKTPLIEASIRLFAAAILMSLAEWLGKRTRKLENMTWLDALFIGMMQVIAIFPGASRSGTTISAGMFRGFDRPSAARFAFLMSVPVMLAAGAYESLDLIKMPNLGSFLPLLAVGFITAAVVGWLAIKWLLNYLNKNSLYLFAIYCALLGLLVLLTSCSPTPPAAIPEAITVQYTAAAQPWLKDLYDCAGVNTVIAELRAANYLEFNHNTMSIRIGEPVFLTAPAYQIGSEEIVTVVNPQNQIGDLAAENVRSIFSGRITRWDELGGKKAPVQVWVFASGEDLQQVFDAQVMGRMPVTSHARLAASPQEMINAIAADSNAIGILTRRWMESNVREVFTSASVPVLALTSSEPQGTIQALISCLQK